ncbi:MAG: radical SAM protein [Peptococcaceae bacterium]
MEKYKYIFGPIPSRRLGNSLGVSPIPGKYCNYSCVYCQLGRTNTLTVTRGEYVNVNDILREFKQYSTEKIKFDVVSIVGEGEPTLNINLGKLIRELKQHTVKPVVVITNGSLLADGAVREQLLAADIVMPSLDAYDQQSLVKINRPDKKIAFSEIYTGLKMFAGEFTGRLWPEIMLIKGINDDKKSLTKFKDLLAEVRHDRLFINTPVRPPAEKWVEAPERKTLEDAVDILGGSSLEMLASGAFVSELEDDLEAVLSIIQRHPMNQHEVSAFLKSRGVQNEGEIFKKLSDNELVEVMDYKGYQTFRYFKGERIR